MKHIKIFEEYDDFSWQRMKIEEGRKMAKKMINWNLIKDAKEMSLEYLDKGYELRIKIMQDLIIYFEIFSHDVSIDKPDGSITGIPNPKSKLKYQFYLLSEDQFHKVNFEKQDSEELVDRLREAYPNENILI